MLPAFLCLFYKTSCPYLYPNILFWSSHQHLAPPHSKHSARHIPTHLAVLQFKHNYLPTRSNNCIRSSPWRRGRFSSSCPSHPRLTESSIRTKTRGFMSIPATPNPSPSRLTMCPASLVAFYPLDLSTQASTTFFSPLMDHTPSTCRNQSFP